MRANSSNHSDRANDYFLGDVLSATAVVAAKLGSLRNHDADDNKNVSNLHTDSEKK